MPGHLALGGAGAAAGAAAPAPEPDDIAGLQGWWKADALVLSDNDAVATWTDSSGNGRDLTEATNRPTYKTNILNSQPVVRFDGTNDKLTGAASSNFLANNAFTIIAVIRASAITLDSSPAVYDGHPVIGDSGYYGIYVTTDLGASIYNYDGSVDAASVALAATTWARLEARHDSGSIYIRKDGATEGSAASGNTEALTELFTISNISSRFFAGDVAEVCVYNVAVSLSDRDAIDDYLAAKYAL